MNVQRRMFAAFVAGSVMVGVFGVHRAAGAEESASTPDGGEVVAAVLGDQTSDAIPFPVGDSSMVVVEHGTVVDVPKDPADGLTVDTAGSGVEVTVTPLDDTLGEFNVVAGDPVAVAEGDGYETVAQPLADGDFRLAVTISGPDSPHSFAYEMDLPGGDQRVEAK